MSRVAFLGLLGAAHERPARRSRAFSRRAIFARQASSNFTPRPTEWARRMSFLSAWISALIVSAVFMSRSLVRIGSCNPSSVRNGPRRGAPQGQRSPLTPERGDKPARPGRNGEPANGQRLHTRGYGNSPEQAIQRATLRDFGPFSGVPGPLTRDLQDQLGGPLSARTSSSDDERRRRTRVRSRGRSTDVRASRRL